MILPYNPCDDGVCAKVWECLRRNEGFVRSTLKARDLPKGKRASAWGQLIDRYEVENPCAAAALDYLLPLEGTYTYNKPQEGSVDDGCYSRGSAQYREYGEPPALNVTWPKTEKSLRGKISSAWEEVLAPLPFPMPYQPWAELFIGNSFIGVPKIVRDSAHRRAIMKELAKLVPIARKKAHLLDEGSFLGSQMEWESYLMTEYHRPRVQGETPARRERNARLYAAWYYHDRAGFLEWPEDQRLSNAGIEEARSFEIAKQIGHVNRRIEAVESAIRSVFPSFSVL